MIGFSHGNSRKQFKWQMEVSDGVADPLTAGEESKVGVMVESPLVEGRQGLSPDNPLNYGQSIIDACINGENSLIVLEQLSAAVRARRVAETAE